MGPKALPLKIFPAPRHSNIYLHDTGASNSLLSISGAGSEARKNVDAWNARIGGIGCARRAGVRVWGIEIVKSEPGGRRSIGELDRFVEGHAASAGDDCGAAQFAEFS